MTRNFAIVLTLLLLTLTGCKKEGEYYTLDGVTQGSTYHIVFQPKVSSDSSFTAVRDSVALYLERIDNSLSGYNPNSLLTAFNENRPVKPDQIFIDNFLASKEMYQKTGGIFDPSAAPLFDLWGFGFKNGVDVTPSQIDSVRSIIGMHHFRLDSIAIVKDDPRCRLNFNAIAQGYTADYIAARFSAMGMENFLVEVGGEIYAKGHNPKGKLWNVGIDKPIDGNNTPGASIQAIVRISSKGLVTSGDYRKFYMKDGKKISHSINPKTGFPIEHNLLSATVVAETATFADAFATYLMVIGLDEAIKAVEKEEGVEALLIYNSNDTLKVWSSKGMNTFTE
ncbi:MAG: FAD:protein FMN transferase [Bacteroidales bacterium]|nr:FAD:protein FMN transferase [Bacteroidales bacterium]